MLNCAVAENHNTVERAITSVLPPDYRVSSLQGFQMQSKMDKCSWCVIYSRLDGQQITAEDKEMKRNAFRY